MVAGFKPIESNITQNETNNFHNFGFFYWTKLINSEKYIYNWFKSIQFDCFFGVRRFDKSFVHPYTTMLS